MELFCSPTREFVITTISDNGAIRVWNGIDFEFPNDDPWGYKNLKAAQRVANKIEKDKGIKTKVCFWVHSEDDYKPIEKYAKMTGKRWEGCPTQ